MANGSICRVHKDNDFTVIKNYHLRDKKLSFKAKGLLTVVLSLPPTWDYSINGLASLTDCDGITSVKSTLKELKQNGYLIVKKLNPSETKSGRIEYEYHFFEEKQQTEKQDTEILHLEILDVENQRQLNKEKLNTEELNTKHTSNNSKENSNLKGQLFSTPEKPKKQGENKYVEIINELSSNEKVRDALLQYCNFRRSRGLTVQQWELIVKKFKQDSEGKTLEQVLQCIDQCLINGRNSLYYSNRVNKDTQQPQNTPTNDDSPAVIRRKRGSL